MQTMIGVIDRSGIAAIKWLKVTDLIAHPARTLPAP